MFYTFNQISYTQVLHEDSNGLSKLDYFGMELRASMNYQTETIAENLSKLTQVTMKEKVGKGKYFFILPGHSASCKN